MRLGTLVRQARQFRLGDLAFHRIAQRALEHLGVDAPLEQIIGGAAADGLAIDVAVHLGGHHDDRDGAVHLHRLGKDRLPRSRVALVVEQDHVMQVGENRLDRVLGLPAPGEFVGVVTQGAQQLTDERILAAISIDQQHTYGFFAERTKIHVLAAPVCRPVRQ